MSLPYPARLQCQELATALSSRRKTNGLPDEAHLLHVALLSLPAPVEISPEGMARAAITEADFGAAMRPEHSAAEMLALTKEFLRSDADLSPTLDWNLQDITSFFQHTRARIIVVVKSAFSSISADDVPTLVDAYVRPSLHFEAARLEWALHKKAKQDSTRPEPLLQRRKTAGLSSPPPEVRRLWVIWGGCVPEFRSANGRGGRPFRSGSVRIGLTSRGGDE